MSQPDGMPELVGGDTTIEKSQVRRRLVEGDLTAVRADVGPGAVRAVEPHPDMGVRPCAEVEVQIRVRRTSSYTMSRQEPVSYNGDDISTPLSAIGAAAILAETGDLHRFATARALVKHAGLATREKLSGTFVGRTKLTGQGRPCLRLAASRAVDDRVVAVARLGHPTGKPGLRARFQHLTTRETNRLTATQDQAVIAATILRQLHAVVVGHGQPQLAV